MMRGSSAARPCCERNPRQVSKKVTTATMADLFRRVLPMIPYLLISRCMSLHGDSILVRSGDPSFILSSLTSRPDLIAGLGWSEQLTLANLGDLSDSLAQVASAQIDLDPDPIALGDLLLLQ